MFRTYTSKRSLILREENGSGTNTKTPIPLLKMKADTLSSTPLAIGVAGKTTATFISRHSRLSLCWHNPMS